MDYGRLAREIHVANETLRSFAEGRCELTDEQLCALAKELWQFTEFDPKQNLLKPSNKTPPIKLPQPLPPVTAPADHVMHQYTIGPQLEKPEKPKAKTRPGWLGGW